MSDQTYTPSFRPLAMLAGMAIPGLGQFVAGERSRGVCVFAGVMGLFITGLLVGGVDTIDSKEDRVWFYGQALVGPATFGVDWYHQNRLKVIDARGMLRTANPGEGRGPDGKVLAGGTPPNSKSVAKMNEIGTLYSTVAGMLNVIVVLDAGFPGRRGRKGKGAPEGAKA
ncbi:MAG: DUF6677 family protein [Phycisphaerales bacterium]